MIKITGNKIKNNGSGIKISGSTNITLDQMVNGRLFEIKKGVYKIDGKEVTKDEFLAESKGFFKID